MSVRVGSRYGSWPEFGPEHYLPPLGTAKKYPADWRKPTVFDLAKRDGWTCAYCGVGLEPKGSWQDDDSMLYPSIDHVVPSHRGGGDTNYNAVLSCIPCNLKKKTRHPAVMFT